MLIALLILSVLQLILLASMVIVLLAFRDAVAHIEMMTAFHVSGDRVVLGDLDEED